MLGYASLRPLLVVLAVSLFPTLAQSSAEGAQNLDALQKPVSVWEWGLERLETRVAGMRWDADVSTVLLYPQEVRVSHDVKVNEITISIRLFQRYASTGTMNPRSTCSSVTRQIKTLLGVKPRVLGLGIETSFTLRSNQEKSDPSLGPTLEAMTSIDVIVESNTSDRSPFQERAHCRSMLLEN
jgi:hypothetical protein